MSFSRLPAGLRLYFEPAPLADIFREDFVALDLAVVAAHGPSVETHGDRVAVLAPPDGLRFHRST